MRNMERLRAISDFWHFKAKHHSKSRAITHSFHSLKYTNTKKSSFYVRVLLNCLF